MRRLGELFEKRRKRHGDHWAVVIVFGIEVESGARSAHVHNCAGLCGTEVVYDPVEPWVHAEKRHF